MSAVMEKPETVAGQHLTPTETRILEVLQSAPGQPFSRSDLVALVMPGTIVLERTIDVHIRGLRKKLGDAARRIQTIRKVGYRFWNP
jgi:two-component system, OmpR family, phosphate regulon response regulator PhoB